MPQPIRLEALETLDAIDRHGSFAAAAAALYRVPSSISYTINQLEDELGIDVFDRSGHRATLTPAGQLLLDEGRRILSANRELGEAARRLANHWEPELRIAVNTLIAPATLWPAIAAFSEAHPAISIRLLEEVRGGAWEALMDRRADLAVGVTEPPGTAGVHRRAYRDVELVFCCSPNHSLTARDHPLTADDIREHRMIAVGDTARQFAAPPGIPGLLDGQAHLTVGTMHSKIQAITHGLGVGYCPRPWVAPALACGELASPPIEAPRSPVSTWLLWRRGESGRALHWFIDDLSPNANG